jgi:hypothetical protein
MRSSGSKLFFGDAHGNLLALFGSQGSKFNRARYSCLGCRTGSLLDSLASEPSSAADAFRLLVRLVRLALALKIIDLNPNFVLHLAGCPMRVSSRSFVVVIRQNGLGRQNCSGDSGTLFRADSDRSCFYLHRDTSNNDAVAHMVPLITAQNLSRLGI